MENAEEPKKGGITNNFYGPIGQYIEHVEHNHFGMSGDGSFDYDASAQHKLFPELPTREVMCKAVMTAVQNGLWYGKQAWAVVYRVYQLKGYMGGMNEFVREVNKWPIEMAATCSYDAVQKPVAKGKMVGQAEKWAKNGAPKEAVALVETLLTAIDKMVINE